MEIPLIYIKDKQAFVKEQGVLRLLGNPVDIAKKIKDKGYKLIHIVDEDALKGMSKNLDIYDKLTYVINVQVECAPDMDLVKKLLSLRCRVVLPPDADVSALQEKNLLVAKIPKGYAGAASGFNDVILEDQSEIERFSALGRRIIVYGKAEEKVWGTIVLSF